MTDPLQVALAYLARGWKPIPVPFRSRRPRDDEWQKRAIDAANAPQHFNDGPQNIGVQLGPVSNGLTDVDLDCVEAVAIAPYMLPKTAAIFGRSGKRASHWLYRTELGDRADLKAAEQFKAPGKDKVMLCELRIGGTAGAQTVFPGSAHEHTGELITWEPQCDGEPAKVDGDTLLKLVKRVAAAALLARHWPTAQGSRHDTALIVGGFLARCSFSETDARTFLEAIARAANDPEWRDRATAGRDAVRQHRSGGKHYGFPELLNTFGKAVAIKVAEWLGADSTEPITTTPSVASASKEAPPFSDEALALCFASEHADDARHVATWSKWLRYDGTCWCVDETMHAFDAARAVCRAVAAEVNKPGMRRGLASAKTVAAVERLARADRRLATSAEQWDADAWTFNTGERA